VTVTSRSKLLLVDYSRRKLFLEITPSAAIAVSVVPSVPIKSRPAKNDVAIFMMVTSFLFVCSNKTHGKLCASACCDQKGLVSCRVTIAHS